MQGVVWCVAALVVVCGGEAAEARLVFPPGTDMGYIIPDEPDPEIYYYEDEGVQNQLGVEEDSPESQHRNQRQVLGQVMEGELQQAQGQQQDPELSQWKGAWFPHPPKGGSIKQGVPADLPEELKDEQHGVAMGIPSTKCDNGKINLTLDWDFSPVNYTCFSPKTHRLRVREDLASLQRCTQLPASYMPLHICMNQPIQYNDTLPTYGPHRPIWPVFGEYKFVPPQRWLHNIEHGAIVMLYHPCAEPSVVQQLRKIVTGCIRKHIISPYTLLTPERPLALLAWGCSLEMAKVDEEEVKEYIRRRALHGPEGHYTADGVYKEALIRKAQVPVGSDKNDSNLCPK